MDSRRFPNQGLSLVCLFNPQIPPLCSSQQPTEEKLDSSLVRTVAEGEEGNKARLKSQDNDQTNAPELIRDQGNLLFEVAPGGSVCVNSQSVRRIFWRPFLMHERDLRRLQEKGPACATHFKFMKLSGQHNLITPPPSI